MRAVQGPNFRRMAEYSARRAIKRLKLHEEEKWLVSMRPKHCRMAKSLSLKVINKSG